jgi:hypothetical protein
VVFYFAIVVCFELEIRLVVLFGENCIAIGAIT